MKKYLDQSINLILNQLKLQPTMTLNWTYSISLSLYFIFTLVHLTLQHNQGKTKQ
jgi:hypothetical protein